MAAFASQPKTREPVIASEPPRIAVAGVVKRWPRHQVPVLQDIELELAPGTLTGLVGRNGAGKTTLLRIMAGLITADEGTVLLDGLHPRRDRLEYQRRLGFLSAGYGGLYARFLVRQHLDYWARLALVPATRRREATTRALDRFELAELASRRVDRLSMGQRQRVRLAMTFLHEPRVVLLDEPWNSLDSEGSDLLTEVLADFTAAGGTAVCCTPTVAENSRLDEVYVIEDGGLRRS